MDNNGLALPSAALAPSGLSPEAGSQAKQPATNASERTAAQFFFEVGYGACWAEAFIRNGEKPPFSLTDAIVERAWEIAPEAHDDHEEFDHYLALANAATITAQPNYPTKAPSVTQADRDAAAAFGRWFGWLVDECVAIERGDCDRAFLVQAFARHRLCAIPTPPADPADLASSLERILFRRVIERRIDGYTREASQELARTALTIIAAMPADTDLIAVDAAARTPRPHSTGARRMTTASGLKPPVETGTGSMRSTKAAVPERQAPTTPAINQGEAEILREALAELEDACDEVASTRSPETYIRMIDIDKATPALIRLDEARRAARNFLTAQGGER